jgi:hypothetical protein
VRLLLKLIETWEVSTTSRQSESNYLVCCGYRLDLLITQARKSWSGIVLKCFLLALSKFWIGKWCNPIPTSCNVAKCYATKSPSQLFLRRFLATACHNRHAGIHLSRSAYWFDNTFRVVGKFLLLSSSITESHSTLTPCLCVQLVVSTKLLFCAVILSENPLRGVLKSFPTLLANVVSLVVVARNTAIEGFADKPLGRL